MTAEEMWKKSGIDGTYEAWCFGGAPDKLAELVLHGKKTATASAYPLYKADGEELPKVGEYSVILDSKDEAVCVIRTTKVYVETFENVSERHAALEGEGDLSLEYWRCVHREFFTDELKPYGMKFDEKMKVVCEEFEKVYPK